MPVAAVGAAAVVGSAYIQHRSANNANKAQQRATDQALAHETSREAVSDKRYNDAAARVAAGDAAYQRDLAEWKARHGYGGASAGGGNGVAIPNLVQANGPVAKNGGDPSAAMSAMGAGAQPQTLQQLAGTPMGAGPMGTPGPTPDQVGSMADASTGQGGTLRDLAEWNDWRAKGLGV